jgi:hypothetical protein
MPAEIFSDRKPHLASYLFAASDQMQRSLRERGASTDSLAIAARAI